MKISSTLAFAALFAASAMSYAQQFSVKVSMPGLPEGAKVKLCNEEHKTNVYAEGVVKKGTVTLNGDIDSPAMAELQINDKASYAEKEYPRSRFVTFMLSDTIINVSATSFEDIPYTYEYGKQPIEKEMNAKVEGGILQQHYEQWRKESFPYRFALYQADNELWKMKYGPDSRNRTAEQEAADAEREPAMKIKIAEKQTLLDGFNEYFLTAHPTYAHALKIVESKLAKSFCYTESEIDAMVALVKDNENTAGYEALVKNAEKAKHFLKNSEITDFKVELPDGTPSTFKEVFKDIMDKPYKAVLVDFWASWCGPCRASIPNVKQLHNATKDQIAILSISVDRKAEDWKGAMEQENMPWMQLRSLPSESKLLTDSYNLLGIPSIFIVSPEGQILFFTHDADEAHNVIEAMQD